MKIKIGYKTYTVQDMSVEEIHKTGNYGDCQHSEEIININRTASETEQLNTLLHEVLHGCFYVGGIRHVNSLTLDQEESIVRVLANVFQEVLRENPKFYKMLGVDSKK